MGCVGSGGIGYGAVGLGMPAKIWLRRGVAAAWLAGTLQLAASLSLPFGGKRAGSGVVEVGVLQI